MTTHQAVGNRNPSFGVDQRHSHHSQWTRNSLLVAIITFTLLASFASAQSTAMLSGVVKDSSGAMITAANITVTNQLTSEHRTVATNAEGYFALPGLLVGKYTLNAQAKGFVSYLAKDILLNAADSKTLNITLAPGATAETVEVSAEASSVAVVDSGEKASVLTSTDLENATLASRNAAEIVRILGGATMTANGGKNTPNTTSTIGINGYTVGGNAAGLGGTQINGQALDITLDGGHVFDPGAAGSATPVNPNMDMISEVKVLASNFSAEYEKGPVVINAETKGGGSHYHGQVHLVAQNYNLNGTDMSVRQSKQKKGASSAYYPGAQLGGPIPFGSYNRNHDKLFFFEGFEAYRQTVDGLLARAVVPTDAMLTGDFSATQVAGLGVWPQNTVPTYSGSGQPWSSERPNCTITAGVLSPGCIDPNGQKLLTAYFPRANADPLTNQGFNYVGQVLTDQNSWQNITREDWNISSNTKVFVRYSAQREVSNQPLGLWGNSGADSVVPAPTNDIGTYKSDSYAASLMHVFTPTMISETTFTYTFEGMPNKPADFSKVSRAGLGLSITGVYGNLQAPAFTAWGPAMPNIGSGANLGANYSPTPGVRTSPGMIANKGMPSVRENFSKVINAHTIKVGAYWEHIYNKQDNWGQYTGVFQMPQGWGTTVGNNYADILMGIDSGQYAEQQLPPPTQISQNLYEFYANDHWKVTRRLTVDFGMRFDHFGKPYSENNLGLAIFDASKYSNDPAQLDAHTGVLWHGIDHNIPLSGADSRLFFYSPRFGAAWDIFGNARTIVRGGFGFFRAYDSLQSNAYTGPAQVAMGAGNFSCNAWSCPTFEDIDNSAVNHPLPAGLPPGLQPVNVVDPKNNQQPLVKTYSLSVDQQLPGKFFLELSYVGNKGSEQQSPVDVNAVPLGTIPYSYAVACNQAGNCNYDPYRPRTNYQAITESITLGTSQFDSLQVSLHRSYGWLNLLANYTWSKAFTNGIVGNSCCQSGGFPDRGGSEYWGIAPNNRPQAFNLSYTLNLPKVRSGNAFLRGAGNGWQIGGITTVQSGANETAQSYYLNYGQDNDNGAGLINDAAGRLGTPQITMMPTIICDPRVNQQVTMSDGTIARRYLNPACFTPAAPGTAGTTHMPYLPGPSFWNSDISLTKNFVLTERQRVSFKVQAFDFLNHGLWSFNPNDPNLQIKFNADGSLKNNNFGIATREFGHRTIELSARYEF
jgi:Carboxypeptidase regulatory-like domain